MQQSSKNETIITPREMSRKASYLACLCKAMTIKQIGDVKEVIQEKANAVTVYMQDGLLGMLNVRI